MKYLTLFLMFGFLSPVYGGRQKAIESTPELRGSTSASSTPRTRSQTILDKRRRHVFEGDDLPSAQDAAIGSPLPLMLSSFAAHSSSMAQTSIRSSTVRPATIVIFYPDDVKEEDIFGPEPTNAFVDTEPPHCRQGEIYRAAQKAKRIRK